MLFLPALGSEAVCAPGLPPLQSPHLRQGKGPGGFWRNQHSPQSRAFLSEELPPSSAGCTPTASLSRCNTCRFLGHHKLPGHHACHPPQTQGHAAGHKHLPQPSKPLQNLTLPPCAGYLCWACSTWHRASPQLSGEPRGTWGKAEAQSEARYWYTSQVLPKSVERSISIAVGSGDCSSGERGTRVRPCPQLASTRGRIFQQDGGPAPCSAPPKHQGNGGKGEWGTIAGLLPIRSLGGAMH